MINANANGNKADSSWMILSFYLTSDRSKLPENWIPGFRAYAFLFNTRREVCNSTGQITNNALQLIEGDCSPSSPLPSQDRLVNQSFVFEIYYMPSLAEYLAPLSTPRDALLATEQNVYEGGNRWLMSTFTATVAAMYWLRVTVSVRTRRLRRQWYISALE